MRKNLKNIIRSCAFDIYKKNIAKKFLDFLSQSKYQIILNKIQH